MYWKKEANQNQVDENKLDDIAANQITEKDILDQARANKARKFEISFLEDKTTLTNHVKSIVPTGKNDCFFVLEENSSHAKLMSKDIQEIGNIETRKLSIYEQKGAIQDLAYDAEHDVVGFVTTDKKMYFYEGSGRLNLLHIAEKFKKNYNGIWYLPKRSLWVVSSVDHYISMWRVHRQGLIFLAVEIDH